VYGVTGTVFSNDLIASVKYPDAVTGSPSNSNKRSFAYDALGEQVSETEANGAVRGYTYDVTGRLRADGVTTTDGSGNPASHFGYDVTGNPVARTDPRG